MNALSKSRALISMFYLWVGVVPLLAETQFTSVTIWRSFEQRGGAISGLFEVDVEADAGKFLTVTTPTAAVHELEEEEFEPGSYEYFVRDVADLDAQYPQGDYVLRLYSDESKTTLEETLVVSFGDENGDPLPFPEVYPALTQPMPTGDQVHAASGQTYAWQEYGGTAGTATHMTFEITCTGEADEDVAGYDAEINGSCFFTPSPIPAGDYDLELAFFCRQTGQTTGGTLIECANEKYAKYALTVADYVYSITEDDEITIAAYVGAGGNVVIPEMIEGLPVTGISDSAFSWKNDVTHVSIPASVISIHERAFIYCPGLVSIEVAVGNPAYSSLDGVLFDVGRRTLLRYPEGRVGNYTVPEGVEHIANRAFYYCLNHLTGVALPSSVVSIGDEAFGMCFALAEADLSTSVETIGQGAFFLCNSLTSLALPASVTQIGDNAFMHCSSLTEMVLPEGLLSIGFQMFHSCSSLTSVVIPVSVTSIGQGAFSYCSSLTGVELPAGLTSIGSSAFSYCTLLSGISIPDGVIDLGAQAFGWCSSLAGVLIPGSVASVGDAAFSQCQALSSVILSNGVSSIGAYAFSSCHNLAAITLPESLVSIGQGAFMQCSKLASIEVDDANAAYSSHGGVLFDKDRTQLLLCPEGKAGGYDIPDGVEIIREYAFASCVFMTEISIPDSVVSIGSGAFGGCVGLTTVRIGSGIEEIGNSVFSSCTSLVSIMIPANVNSIGSGAFFGCGSLTNVVIAGDVTHLGYMAFYGCTSLMTINLPASLNSVEDSAFSNCLALESVYFLGNAPNSVGAELFQGSSESMIIYHLAGTTGWDLTFGDRPTALWLFTLSVDRGPYAGGNNLTISSGNLGTVTNVLVGGVTAAIAGSGDGWITIIVPALDSAGVKDIVIEALEYGDVTLTGIYTVNPAGVIGSNPQAAIAGGGGHSLGLKSDGSIVAWGSNEVGQISVPSPNTDFAAVTAGGNHSLGLKSDGSILAWGHNDYDQTAVPSPNADFVAVAAGWEHSLGLKSDGRIVAWGRNYHGQTAVPSPNTDFVAVAAGMDHSLGLKVDGSIVAWGRNDSGQTAVPSPNEDFVAVAAGWEHSLGLKSDGSIVCWSADGAGQVPVPLPNTDFVAIAAGAYHSLGLKSNGSIVAWSDNSFGQTDVPSPNAEFVAIAAGAFHSMGLKSDGSIVAWGYNYYGQTNVPAPNTNFGLSNGVQPNAGSRLGGCEVVISGANLGNGSDITDVTLCGVSAAIISQSSTQVVVTAGAGAPGTGDVVVTSTSYGVTTKINGFTYLKTEQAIDFPEISVKLTTDMVELSASASSGLPVAFSVLSGPASISGGTHLTFTGAGTVSIVASQAGDAYWNAATDVTRTFEVMGMPVIEKAITKFMLSTGSSGTLVNGPSRVPGRYGNGLSLSNGQYVTVPAPSPDRFNITGDLTLALWIKPNSVTCTGADPGYALISKRSSNRSTPYELFIVNGGGLILHYYGTNIQWPNFLSSGVVSVGVWQHVAVTRSFSGSTATVTFYINGIEAGKSTGATGAALGSPDPVWISRDGYHTGLTQQGSYSGLMDEVQIYDRALTGAEIAKIHSNDDACMTGRVGNWRFDETSGSSASNTLADGVIHEPGKTITLVVPDGTDVSALVPWIQTSPDTTVFPLSGSVQNFNSPVLYTVTAADLSAQGYTATVVGCSSSFDGDGNGLPDAWEALNFRATGIDPAAICANGMNTMLDAYVIGLDPNDPASRFHLRIEPVAGQPTQRRLVFSPCFDDRTYGILASTTLEPDSWTLLTDGIPEGVGHERAVTDPDAGADRTFYRVKIIKP
jgi:hypothetical protein